MTTEEKAKKYDEALKRAIEWKEKYSSIISSDGTMAKDFDSIFPQITESEDERIRRSLIEYHKKLYERNRNDETAPFHRDALEWLKKQKESLHIPETCKENANSFIDEDERIRKILLKMAKVPRKEIYEHEGITKEQAISYLEKQKELPFVKDVILGFPGLYFYDGERMHFGGSPAMEEKQKEQKPADFPTTDEEMKDFLDKTHSVEVPEKYKTADWLFDKMRQKHADYDHEMWKNCEANFEGGKKEVIEHPEKYGLQKPADLPAGFYVTLPDGKKYYTKEMRCNGMNVKVVEPKPAEWSKEDETAVGDLMWCIEQAMKSAKDENDMGNIWFAENWVKNRLKSLRPQYNGDVTMTEAYKMGKEAGEASSWKPSEEEERLINTTISFLKDFADKGYENAVECIDWLKSKLNGKSTDAK